RNALIERLLAGGLDGAYPVGQHAGEDLHHLPVAIVCCLELAAYLLHGRRQDPSPERRAVAQAARLARQHRHVVPGIVDHLAAPERTGMIADDYTVLADDDPVGIGMDLDRPAHGTRKHGVFVVIEAHGASLRHRGGDAMEAVEAPGIGNEAGAFFLEHVPDRALALLGVSARLCPGDAFVGQPAVHILQRFEAQPRREEALAHQPNLVLDLTLLPACRWRAG